MTETTNPEVENLIQILDQLDEIVAGRSEQPLHQLAESAVLYWLRVVEEKDVLVPRLGNGETTSQSFRDGMETVVENRLDPHTPGASPTEFEQEAAARQDSLQQILGDYFERSGYRGSSEQCDLLAMEVDRHSRFLSSCCLEADLHGAAMEQQGEVRQMEDAAAREYSADHKALLRRNLFVWEPVLNEVLVAWEQNSLNDFDFALRQLESLLTMTDHERESRHVLPGYPIRPQGRGRLKIAVFEPVIRPLRTKSMFKIRHGQLVNRILTTVIPGGMAPLLAEDMLHFITMARNNCYMLASEPSFWDTHRVGLPLIRGKPAGHPFLNAPVDFFKKAVLFHNRTYTVAGGGVDRMYVQVKQLERFYKFQSTGSSRAMRQRLAVCKRKWEENRWDAFTENLLRLAEQLRVQAAADAS